MIALYTGTRLFKCISLTSLEMNLSSTTAFFIPNVPAHCCRNVNRLVTLLSWRCHLLSSMSSPDFCISFKAIIRNKNDTRHTPATPVAFVRLGLISTAAPRKWFSDFFLNCPWIFLSLPRSLSPSVRNFFRNKQLNLYKTSQKSQVSERSTKRSRSKKPTPWREVPSFRYFKL